MTNASRRGLYAIVDVDALQGRDPLAFADRVLQAGELFALQLRAKHWPARKVLESARAIGWRCRRAGVPFFVNDRPDLAWLAGASGVHVGQDDLSVAEARAVAEGLRVGISTHNDDQVRAALSTRPDYVAIGPVFATGSKDRPDPVVGLEGVSRAVELATGAGGSSGVVPVVAIGGITLERAQSVRDAGATAGAVIAALCSLPDDRVTAGALELHRALGG